MTLPRRLREPLRAAGLHRQGGHWHSYWRHSPTAMRLVERRLVKRMQTETADAVLEVGDLGRVDQPFYIWQDLSYDLLIEQADKFGSVPHFKGLSIDDLKRLRDRQLEIYSQAAGVIAMSKWLAQSLVRSGVPEERIHVVNPGMNSALNDKAGPPIGRRPSKPFRLLFIGRDFDTKAGDQVVGAFKLLRRQLGADICLTIAGPPTFPFGQVPSGVNFLGPLHPMSVPALYETHDLFVMPSRFEGFGIVFLEALARGMPCIARRRCAMPEIVDERSGGRLIEGDDPRELADAILVALHDDRLYRACAATAPERRNYYTWDRAAQEMLVALRLR